MNQIDGRTEESGTAELRALLKARERHNRHISFLMTFSLVLFSTLWLCGSRFDGSIALVSTRRLNITDSRGIVRVSVGVAEKDGGELAELILRDEKGTGRLRLAVKPSGDAGIVLGDGPEGTRMLITSRIQGETGLMIADDTHRKVLGMGVERGKPSMHFLGSSEKGALHLELGIKEGSSDAGLWVYRAGDVAALLGEGGKSKAKEVMRFAAGTEGVTRLSLWDAGGKNRFRIEADSDGLSGLSVFDRDEKTQFLLGTKSDGETVVRLPVQERKGNARGE
jgi:hypothetical protein